MCKLIAIIIGLLACHFINAQKVFRRISYPPATSDTTVKPMSSYEVKNDGSLKLGAKANLDSNSSSITARTDDAATGLPQGAAEAKLPNVVLPSPNSATLVNLISENVDLYVGKLNIEIPLYTLKSRDIEVPISLQGNINSHKVNEYATWVGLGWNLNAGGVITRVMNNLPDEMTGAVGTSPINSTYFNIKGVGYIYLKSNENVDLLHFDPDPPVSAYTTDQMKDIINKGSWNTKDDQPSKAYDLQPDDFYYNFGKYSGKFIFDQDGHINTVPKNNLTIIPSYAIRDGHNKIVSFTVVTEDGFTYEFGNYSLNAVEETKLKTESKSSKFVYPAYYATDIYGNQYPIADQSSGFNYYWYSRYPMMLSHETPVDYHVGGPYIPNSLDNFDYGTNIQALEYFFYSSSWYLTKIISPSGDFINFIYADNGTISYLADRNFNASTIDFVESSTSQTGPLFLAPKEPMWNPTLKMLYYPGNQIFTVTSSTIDVKSKRLSSITSEQGYSISFEANTQRQDFPNDKRLDDIVVNNGSQIIKEFSFNYSNQYDNSALESFKFTYNRPVYVYPTPQGYYQGIAYIYGSDPNRTFNVPDYCRYRMFLTSVQEKGANAESIPPYQFEYYNIGSLPFRTSTEQDFFGFANSNPNRHPFVRPQYQYNYPFWGSTSYTAPSVAPVSILAFLTQNAGNNDQWPPSNLYGNKNYTAARLDAGVLKKIIYPTGGYKEFNFEFNGNQSAWNGLRIKEIKDYTSSTATPITKTYTYGTFYPTDGSVESYKMPERLETINNAYVPSIHRVFFGSSRSNPEALTRGSAGGYDYAEVSQTNNGKYRIEFTNPSQSGFTDGSNPSKIVSSFLNPAVQNLGYLYPFAPVSTVDYKRGMVLNEYYYKTGNIPVRAVTYNYDFAPIFINPTITFGLQTSKYKVNALSDWNWMLFGRTTYTSHWYTPSVKETREYASNGVDFLSTREEYVFKKNDFNNKEFVFMDQSKLMSDSRNEQVITKFKYTLDYSSSSNDHTWGILILKQKNLLSSIIESYQYIQDQSGGNRRYLTGSLNEYYPNAPLKTRIYRYQPSSLNSSFIESSMAAQGGNFSYDPNYKVVQNFNVYDLNGNILEQNKDADAKESYIWDYGHTLPVARIINASSNEVAYTSFESDGFGNWGYSQNGVINAPGITGKKYFDISYGMWINSTPQIPTISSTKKYIVSLWSKGANPGLNVNHPNGTSDILLFESSTPKITIGDWHYFEISVENAVGVGIWKWGSSASSYVDEVRLFPANSQMTTYTFDPLVGMTSESDANCRTKYYEYDGLQRLKLIKDQFGNVIKTLEYNYKQ